jgi:hypothetical protein
VVVKPTPTATMSWIWRPRMVGKSPPWRLPWAAAPGHASTRTARTPPPTGDRATGGVAYALTGLAAALVQDQAQSLDQRPAQTLAEHVTVADAEVVTTNAWVEETFLRLRELRGEEG